MLRLRELEGEKSRLKKIVAALTLDRKMLQDIVRRSSEVGSEARAGWRNAGGLGRVDPQGLQGPAVRHLMLPLQVPSDRSGRDQEADQGHL